MRTPHTDGSVDSEGKPMRRDMNPNRPLGMSDHRSHVPNLLLVLSKVPPLSDQVGLTCYSESQTSCEPERGDATEYRK